MFFFYSFFLYFSTLPEVVIVSISSVIAGMDGLNWELMGAVLIGVFWGVGAVNFLFLMSTKNQRV